jgi:hypothetical protein
VQGLGGAAVDLLDTQVTGLPDKRFTELERLYIVAVSEQREPEAAGEDEDSEGGERDDSGAR